MLEDGSEREAEAGIALPSWRSIGGALEFPGPWADPSFQVPRPEQSPLPPEHLAEEEACARIEIAVHELTGAAPELWSGASSRLLEMTKGSYPYLLPELAEVYGNILKDHEDDPVRTAVVVKGLGVLACDYDFEVAKSAIDTLRQNIGTERITEAADTFGGIVLRARFVSVSDTAVEALADFAASEHSVRDDAPADYKNEALDELLTVFERLDKERARQLVSFFRLVMEGRDKGTFNNRTHLWECLGGSEETGECRLWHPNEAVRRQLDFLRHDFQVPEGDPAGIKQASWRRPHPSE